MTRAAFWFLWFFGALPLFVIDGWLVHEVAPVPAFTLATCLYCGLFARLAAVPGLLVCAAMARSVLVPGDAALHLLVLGLPVAALLPTRGVFSVRHVLWQALASAFLAVGIPLVTATLGRLAETAPAPSSALGWHEILGAMVLAPTATWMLRVLPPLSGFVERSE